MSRMSKILILSYRLREVTNSYVLHCFWTSKKCHISATRCLIEMRFGSNCSILNKQVIHTENSKSNIADMRLIPLDHVTYKHFRSVHTEATVPRKANELSYLCHRFWRYEIIYIKKKEYLDLTKWHINQQWELQQSKTFKILCVSHKALAK